MRSRPTVASKSAHANPVRHGGELHPGTSVTVPHMNDCQVLSPYCAAVHGCDPETEFPTTGAFPKRFANFRNEIE